MFGILGIDLERIYFCILDILDILSRNQDPHTPESEVDPIRPALLSQLAGHLGVSLETLELTLAAEQQVIF